MVWPGLFWQQYTVNDVNDAIALVNIFNSYSRHSSVFIFQYDFISLHHGPKFPTGNSF